MSSVQRITFKPAQQIKNGLKTKSENGKLVVSTLLENKDKIKKMSKKNDISVKNLNVKLSKNKIDYSLPESSDGSFSKFNQSGDLKNNENQLKVNYKDIVYYFNMNKNNATLSKVRSYLSEQKYENEKESKFFKTDRYR